MKVNEVVSEGVLGAIGRGLGNAATGVVRGLDRLAGGTGDVGTASQRAAYQAKIAKKQQKVIDAKNAGLGRIAAQHFEQELQRQGINIAKPGSFDPAFVQDLMKAFAQHFFVSDANPTIRQYVQAGLTGIEMPAVLNNTTISQYLEDANFVRNHVLKNVVAITAMRAAQQQKAQAQAKQKKQQQQQGPKLNPEVTVISSSPLVLRYRNQDFVLNQDDQWLRFGSNKSPSPEMVDFLNAQLQKL